jgi:hypothetical protein
MEPNILARMLSISETDQHRNFYQYLSIEQVQIKYFKIFRVPKIIDITFIPSNIAFAIYLTYHCLVSLWTLMVVTKKG